VEDAYDGRIAALEDAGYSSGAAAFAVARGFVDEDLVALHSSVELVGRDEEVFLTFLASGRPDEGITIAVQVDASGDEALARGMALDGCVIRSRRSSGLCRDRGGETPVVGVDLDQGSAGGDACELLEEEAALSSSAEAEFANELLIACALAGGAFDEPDELAIGVLIRMARHGSRISLEGCYASV
jgi:hypothetical protein